MQFAAPEQLSYAALVKPSDPAARPVPVQPMVYRSLSNQEVVSSKVSSTDSCHDLRLGPDRHQAACRRIAQAWRAFLFASATAARFLPRRSTRDRSH